MADVGRGPDQGGSTFGDHIKFMPDTLNRASGSPLFGPGIILLLTLAMYGDVLFSVHRPVLSSFGDVSMWDLPWRILAFDELAHGHIMLRNPYTFSGMPFFAESQIAILYPPNWIHLLLPPDRAINLVIAVHTFLLGLFTWFWARYRSLSKPAAVLSGVVMMFGGPSFLHLVPGHATHMAAMAWAPLLFLSCDLICDRCYRRGLLLGSFSLAMQVLAGHPQYVYFTAIALFLYGLLRLIPISNRLKPLVAFASMGLAALVLTAVLTISVLQSAGESVRTGHGAVPYQVAGTFSFPVENFLTFLAPQLFGNSLSAPYWGKWCLWEASVFMGVAGFALALYGVLAAPSRARLPLVMALVLFLLALGSYSPLFPLLYAYLPGFNRFRGDSKFIFQAMLFMSLLAGIGFDALAGHGKARRLLAAGALAGAVLAAGAGIFIGLVAEDGPSGLWGRLMWSTGGAHTYISPAVFQTAPGVAQAGAYAAASCWVSALTLGLIAAFLWAARTPAKAALLMAALALVELFVNARRERPTYPYGTRLDGGVQDFLAKRPGDFRYYTPLEPNDALTSRNYGVWGYDSNISRRYAEFIALTQGLDPDNFDLLTWPTITRFHPLCALLRWRYSFLPAPGGQLQIMEAKSLLPHAFLAQDYRVLTGRDRIFAAMTNATFDPAKTIILESPPAPAPAPGLPRGNARVRSETTDSLTIEANVPEPSLLVITDSYSRFFGATPLPGSSQRHYDVLPADYTLMAIPLAAGNHRLRLEYAPSGYRIGRWISLAGWGLYLGILGVTLARRPRSPQPIPPTTQVAGQPGYSKAPDAG
jgi:hypothetical protein